MPLHTHMKRSSDGPKPLVTAGFTPGGHIPPGYSYLTRSHSLLTPSRRSAPKGMASPQLGRDDITLHSTTSPRTETSLSHSSSNTSLTDSLSSPRLTRSDHDDRGIAELVTQLPPNPKVWTPSQVALYLTHVLGLTPRPVVEDVTAYVRKSRMGGKIFLRLKEKDLESEGLNLKWRKLMIEAVKKLRRDCLRGRIWGYEGGLQLPREKDDLTDDAANDEPVAQARPEANAQGTLKRLRDKKAVREMIFGFEKAQSTNGGEDEGAFVAVGRGNGLRSSSSVSSLHSSNDSAELSPRPLMAPIYGKGFVKARAESFTSLSDVSSQHRREHYTKEELEHWFGSMSDQEAESLANELLQDEELIDETHAWQAEVSSDGHHHSSSSSHSSVSGEGGPTTPPCTEKVGFDLTPIDAHIVHSIIKETQKEAAEQPLDQVRAVLSISPLQRVSALDDDDMDCPPTTLFRPGNGGKSNPYRASTYEPEEVEALGLSLDEEEAMRFSTARKIGHSPVLGNEAADLFTTPSITETHADEAPSPPKHMRNMSAHEASGLSPYAPLSPAMSRRSSQRRHAEGEKSPLALVGMVDACVEEARGNAMGTMSRRSLGGVNGMQLTAMLMASGLAEEQGHGPSSGDDGKKAEDESEWGITFSRKASRRGTMAKKAPREREAPAGATAATRMAELFATDGMHSDNGDAASREPDRLCLPVEHDRTSSDGSMRKRSMVYVERKKFESLNRRMGALEAQLAELDAIKSPPSPAAGSSDDGQKHSRALDEVFTIPQDSVTAPFEDEDETLRELGDDGQRSNRGWGLAMLLGAVPSYALGLGAGVGYVLFNELLGRSHR